MHNFGIFKVDNLSGKPDSIRTYAFNHEESARCFERATKLDPDCALAYWGLAYSIGCNYNKPWSHFDEKDLATVVRRAHSAAKTAESLIPKVSPVEAALIKAIQFRYPEELPTKPCAVWDERFAQAMGQVFDRFPSDLDVITIYAEALMTLTPWKLWDLRAGKPEKGASTIQVKNLLDRALSLPGGLEHPGLLHLYIHLMETSPFPESALHIADHLRGTYVICGQYQQAIASNSAAIEADEKYYRIEGPLNFYTLYRSHDYHFRVYAAMFSGQLQVALDTVARLEASIPEGLLRVESPPMADWLESFLPLRAHVFIRFGRWEDIVRLEVPEDQFLYSMTTSIIHYAKGAQDQKRLFQSAVKRVQPSRSLFNNKCLDILAVAQAMLDGELEYRMGNLGAAFASLRKAIDLEDNLPYDKPWGWMQPVRHAYGALLLEQGHVEQALEAYMADLGMTNVLPRAFLGSWWLKLVAFRPKSKYPRDQHDLSSE
ncbi:TPR-like protein [Aspergillus undulatus]|uniref:TPR-like protein n=1 Tax=Aspergillus undulatus TaxID=1810928 RepID=UPI003CCDE21D